MNSLSWLIYLAQVLTSFGYLGITLSVVSFIVSAIGFNMWLIGSSEDVADHLRPTGLRVVKIAAPLTVIFLIIGNLLPSKETLYAIAASQLGEQVVKSEIVQGMASDAQKALQQWIKRQIEEPAKK